MVTKFLFLAFLLKADVQKDSMLLPFRDGKIVTLASDTNSFCKARTGICIAPSRDLEVKSCSDGKVVQVIKLGNLGYQIMVRYDETYYTYSMIDSVYIKSRQLIKEGESLGLFAFKEDRYPYIVFSVFRNKKALNPESFIVK